MFIFMLHEFTKNINIKRLKRHPKEKKVVRYFNIKIFYVCPTVEFYFEID